MTVYHSQQNNSPITMLESVQEDGKRSRTSLTFCYVDDPSRLDAAKILLQHALPNQHLVGETQVAGRDVLILRGNQTPTQVIAQLHAARLDFTKAPTAKTFNAWKWRGNLSNAGQLLQLASAGLKNKEGFDHSVLGFAVFNLAANMINLVFGAERKPDTNRLRRLNAEFNEQLTPYVAPDTPLPDPDAALTKDRTQKKREALGDSVVGFLKRNSVVFGEIGLRYVGAFNLAFPITQWAGKGRQAFAATQGPLLDKLKAGFGAAGRNFHNKESLIFYSGIAYLVGKTIALGSKIPDPYDTKPHTALDGIRENVLFKTSTALEAAAAATLAVNGLKPGKVTPENPDGARLFTRNREYWLPNAMKGEKFITRDWFGAAGGALFTGGLLIRFSAPFGTREVDMKELYAHMAAALAKVPEDKLPQLVADSALAIKAQFPDKPLEFGNIYTSLVHELEHYHRISLLSPHSSFKLVTDVAPARTQPPTPPSPEKPSTMVDAASTELAQRPVQPQQLRA